MKRIFLTSGRESEILQNYTCVVGEEYLQI